MRAQSKRNPVFFHYVKYCDTDRMMLSFYPEHYLIPNLEGNRLTNDAKMAKRGKADVEKFKGTFFRYIDARVSSNTREQQ